MKFILAGFSDFFSLEDHQRNRRGKRRPFDCMKPTGRQDFEKESCFCERHSGSRLYRIVPDFLLFYHTFGMCQERSQSDFLVILVWKILRNLTIPAVFDKLMDASF